MSDTEEEDFQGGYARRYRPDTLESYVGNTALKQTVFNTMKKPESQWPQAIMLTGNTGCGKTTMARIIIREYLCEDRQPTGACGNCAICELMEDYIKKGENDSLLDLREIDIAQNSGKDAIQSLLEDMNIPPQDLKKKIYYFDECHQASSAAQSSLLKPVEEPFEDVLLIFATTDPEKVMPTIRNRMDMRLRIKKPTTKELIAHLATICKTEGIPYDVAGLRMLAMMSGNVIRDALNYLEQVVKSWGGAEEEVVSKEFEVIGDDVIADFFQAYKNRDYLQYISILYNISESMSIESFIQSMKQYLARGIFVLNSVEVDGLTTAEIAKYKDLFSQFSPAEIATLLANVQKVDRGDPTSNLMAFIYTEEDFKSNPETSERGGIAYDDEVDEAEGESKARSVNIEDLRARGSARAEERLVSETEPVSEQSFLEAFKAKPVRKE